ncbi:Tryptophan dimethylallyltransferase [Aspergillus parasiticus SU-1]|uniref:Tryptophan dimethylallyltransferase n=1 Tax=Aspergillus parasiticus (strain ATCC 56775 / NRRL 5862 / SRRC 143 / SU-1) TaxID=1403190 RepID=A0A0F0INX6_ASPPU|nr:Tryptophan dimethylallyltransferase [Aspergillus parasiticus SU-1]
MTSDSLLQLFSNPDSISPDPRWSQLLAPYLENGLIHATTYSPEEIRKHVEFFIKHIGPHLGPGPLGKDSYQPQYPSAMTDDLTPFELSLCWKDPKQQGRPIVRFVSDIIPLNAERTRIASLTQSQRLIEALRSIAEDTSDLTLHILPDIWNAVSHTLKVSETFIHSGSCSQCGSSSTFTAFDLKKSVISGKFYWRLPFCLDVPGILSLMDQVFSACFAVHEFFESDVFSTSWHQIREHIRNHADTLLPRMISIDATAFPAPRIKVYVNCRFQGDRDFDSWEHHLRFNDSVACPEDFRSTCRDLWNSLTTNPPEWDQTRPDAGPKSCLLLYELTGSSTNAADEQRQKLSSKLYIMCQEIPLPDSVIATQLLRHCELAADADILKFFAAGRKPTNFISEIGLAPRKEGNEVSIYLNPSYFARKSWDVAEDGYMAKPRITLI